MNKNVCEAAQSDQGWHEEQHERVSQDNSDVHNIFIFFHFMGMLFITMKLKEYM